MPDTKSHGRRILQQKAAFAAIRGLSILTIAILALIIGFIAWKGLRFDRETRSTVLPFAEASPKGLAIVVNRESALEVVEAPVLLGIYTDEYINWSKISGEDTDLLPVAVDPATPEGAAARDLVFGAGAAEAIAWGGLVEFVPSPEAALEKVRTTPGSIAVLPHEALRDLAGIATVSLRRLSVVASADAMALVENRQVEDMDDVEVARLVSGGVPSWAALGGPELAVAPIAPPAGSPLEAAAKAAGQKPAGNPAIDMAGYLAALAGAKGGVGLAFAEDLVAFARSGEEAVALANGEAPSLAPLTRRGHERGWNLSLRYLVEEPRLSGRVGGISTIILNTFAMLILTLLIAAPLGVAAAVYLIEYAKQGPLVRILRLGTETLAGIPSIIFGLFGMLFFVDILHFGFGLLSGCLTLTLMILPTIVRTSEEALKSVPRALREGSLALGATKLQTIAKVVLPAAAPGILTGLILGIGRAVGETAALLFTMGSDYKLATGLFSSARALSTHVYLLFAEGISFDRAFSTATVLILIVLLFNVAAKRLVGRMGRNAAA